MQLHTYTRHKNNLADVASDNQLNATVTLIFDILLTGCVYSIIECFDLFRPYRQIRRGIYSFFSFILEMHS